MIARRLVIFVASVLLAGCSSSPDVEPVRHAGETPVITGWVSPEIMLRGPGHVGFKERYDTVKVDEDLLGPIAEFAPAVECLVFYGEWCSDSRRELPHFLRIVQRTGLRARYYALDRTKKSDDGLTGKYAIERVPTFIILKDGNEAGRIVELPRTTVEADLVEILARSR